MTKRTYICNVCRAELNEQCARENKVFGFDFGYGKWECKPANECENHICKSCLEHAARMASELLGGNDGSLR